MAQTKPKAAQFYGVSGDGTAGQVLISDGNGGMSWGSNTELYTVSWATPTGQSLTYTQPSPQSSQGAPGEFFTTTTFTATKSGEEISGTAIIAGLPTGITATQSLSGSGADNILTVTLAGVFPGADSLNTALTISGLTVVPPLTVDYLIVAGGAGGSSAGGGGAGGVLESTSYPLNISTNYTITVGGGGVGAVAAASAIGGNGGNSSVFGLNAIGGGTGGAYRGPMIGANGGSGGGGGQNGTGPISTVAGGSGTSGQGFNGGSGDITDSPWGSGGGGGAGGAGSNFVVSSYPSDFSGNGGPGILNNINGSNLYWAGGGGGGAQGYASRGSSGDKDTAPGNGGIGGGGGGGVTYNTVGPSGYGIGGGSALNNGQNGAYFSAGTSSSTRVGGNGGSNTGGGGGGEGITVGFAGSGGSGVVILRYPSIYTITVPAGLTAATTTVSTDKVTTFTAGTGNIQFN